MSRRLCLGYLCALIVWAPLPFASQRIWAVFLLAGLSLLLLVATLLAVSRSDLKRLSAAAIPIICLMVPAFIGLLFILPLGYILPSYFDYSLSAAPYTSMVLMFKSISYIALFISVLLLVRRRKQVLLLLVMLLISGVLQSLYGSFMTLSGIEYGFLAPKAAGVGNATGTFVNANHFAGYIILCLSAAIGILVSYRDSSHTAGILFFGHPLMLVRVAVALLVVGVLLSSSRAANLILPAAVGVTLFVVSWLRRQFQLRYVTFFVVFLLFDIVIVGYWFGFEEVANRIASSEVSGESRLSVVAVSLSLLSWQTIIGIGPGAFDAIFAEFYAGPKALHFSYAHNDYIQLLLEYGILGFAALTVFVVQTVHKASVMIRFEKSWRLRAAATAVVMAFIWLSLHSLVDFNLYITSNAYTVVLLSALVWSSSQFSNFQRINSEKIEI